MLRKNGWEKSIVSHPCHKNVQRMGHPGSVVLSAVQMQVLRLATAWLAQDDSLAEAFRFKTGARSTQNSLTHGVIGVCVESQGRLNSVL